MKSVFHKSALIEKNTISIFHTAQLGFDTLWHYHPELELHYVVKGEGFRFIGDNISTFSQGELILLGQNLPHLWRCNKNRFSLGDQAEAIVLHFLPDFMGSSFLELPEAWRISHLFYRASRGLLIKGESKERVVSKMLKLQNALGLQKLVLLLKIIEDLIETEDYEIIASNNTSNIAKIEDKRLDKIYNYTLSHYKENIRLVEIADMVNLSPNHFCRYFKQKTGKTYLDLLTEIRISHACRLLVEKEASVENTCNESGFNNITNFFRSFKKLKKMTPAEYRAFVCNKLIDMSEYI